MHSNILLKSRYFYLFVAVLCIGLLLQVPARLLWDQLGAQTLLPPQVKVQQLQGTLWQGEGLLRYQHHQSQDKAVLELKVSWRLGLLAWWSEGAPFVLMAQHVGSDVKLKVQLSSLNNFGVVLSGQVHPLLLNPILKTNQAWIEGVGYIHNLSLSVQHFSLLDLPVFFEGLSRRRLDLNQWPDAQIKLQGMVAWDGGDTYFLAGQNPIKIVYPALALRFSQEGQSLKARLTPQDNDLTLAQVNFDKTGWLSVIVDGQLKRTVPTLPMHAVSAGQSLFKYKEKVF